MTCFFPFSSGTSQVSAGISPWAPGRPGLGAHGHSRGTLHLYVGDYLGALMASRWRVQVAVLA